MVIGQAGNMSIRKQCNLLGINRSMLYYTPKGESDLNLMLMKLIDQEYLNHPFYGSRKMAYFLRSQGYQISRHRIRRLMRLMGLHAIYQKPHISQRNLEHKVYPYLLNDLKIDRSNQVWAADITYIPMKQGFMYLVAILDWYSRKVLSWRLSNTLDTRFCLEALEEAFRLYGIPEIFNSDQGSQFTSIEFTQALKDRHIKISMDSKGRWMDNIMVERLWRSLKYECIYLQEFNTVADLKDSISAWITFYNEDRPHATFNGQAPNQVYNSSLEHGLLAA